MIDNIDIIDISIILVVLGFFGLVLMVIQKSEDKNNSKYEVLTNVLPSTRDKLSAEHVDLAEDIEKIQKQNAELIERICFIEKTIKDNFVVKNQKMDNNNSNIFEYLEFLDNKINALSELNSLIYSNVEKVSSNDENKFLESFENIDRYFNLQSSMSLKIQGLSEDIKKIHDLLENREVVDEYEEDWK